jgi:hypothetical protein
MLKSKNPFFNICTLILYFRCLKLSVALAAQMTKSLTKLNPSNYFIFYMYNCITSYGVKHSVQNRFVGKSDFWVQLVVDFNPVGFGPVVFSNYFIFCMYMYNITTYYGVKYLFQNT